MPAAEQKRRLPDYSFRGRLAELADEHETLEADHRALTAELWRFRGTQSDAKSGAWGSLESSSANVGSRKDPAGFSLVSPGGGVGIERNRVPIAVMPPPLEEDEIFLELPVPIDPTAASIGLPVRASPPALPNLPNPETSSLAVAETADVAQATDVLPPTSVATRPQSTISDQFLGAASSIPDEPHGIFRAVMSSSTSSSSGHLSRAVCAVNPSNSAYTASISLALGQGAAKHHHISEQQDQIDETGVQGADQQHQQHGVQLVADAVIKAPLRLSDAVRHWLASAGRLTGFSSKHFGSSSHSWDREQSTASQPFPQWYDPEKRSRPQDSARAAIQSRSPSRTLAVATCGPADFMVGEERPTSRCVLSPVSWIRLLWDCVAMCSLLFELWVIPFQLIFFSGQLPTSMLAAVHGVTIFFCADLLLNFNTGYIDKARTIMNRESIVINYFRCWFWFDFIATIPLDVILASMDLNVLAMVRLAKATKVLKTLRFLKLLRSFRMVSGFRTVDVQFRSFAPLTYPLRLIQTVVFITFISHVHGCAWAALHPDWAIGEELEEALHKYYESFMWAYTLFCFGEFSTTVGKETAALWALEIIIAFERMLLVIFIALWSVCRALCLYEEETRFTLARRSAIRYLQGNDVSVGAQIQVLHSLHETARVRREQRQFDALMTNELPKELRRMISYELWADRLLTLGLITHIATWHADLVAELTLLVREETFGSKAIIFREGDASLAAYYITRGVLVVSSRAEHAIPEFVVGMWVGEKALVNTLLRRSGTLYAKTMSTLMIVAGDEFHDLLSRLGAIERFRELCQDHLWQGLCGRCGMLGDHFSHTCPMLRRQSAHLLPAIGRSWIYRIAGTFWWFGPAVRQCLHRSDQQANAASDIPITRPHDTFTQEAELQAFLRLHRLLKLAPALRSVGVLSLDDLETMDVSRLLSEFSNGSCGDEAALAPDAVRRFRARIRVSGQDVVTHGLSRPQHLLFLSHYKLEAGTDAALLRTEIEEALREDPGSPARNFDVPVFLDSEDLSDLEDLQERVRNSHNLALLLTRDVLMRPWVLVELVTAITSGVRVLPVLVVRPGNEFHIPDATFYQNLVGGAVLDEGSERVLRECGVELGDVAHVLRSVFQRIVVPYSPHRPVSIRKAEVRGLLKQCVLTRGGRVEAPLLQPSLTREGSMRAARKSDASDFSSNASTRQLAVERAASAPSDRTGIARLRSNSRSSI